jgi:hypothetical protein
MRKLKMPRKGLINLESFIKISILIILAVKKSGGLKPLSPRLRGPYGVPKFDYLFLRHPVYDDILLKYQPQVETEIWINIVQLNNMNVLSHRSIITYLQMGCMLKGWAKAGLKRDGTNMVHPMVPP